MSAVLDGVKAVKGEESGEADVSGLATIKAKTYNSGDSLVVTHLTTNPPVQCLSTAERTGSSVFIVLWSYVSVESTACCYILLDIGAYHTKHEPLMAQQSTQKEQQWANITFRRRSRLLYRADLRRLSMALIEKGAGPIQLWLYLAFVSTCSRNRLFSFLWYLFSPIYGWLT
jgi:hypothetical protein